MQAWKVFDKKMASFFSAINHVKLQWKIDAQKHNMEIVQNLLEVNVRMCCYDDENEGVERAFVKFQNDVAKKVQLPLSSVITIGFVNWVAPSTTPSKIMDRQGQMMSLICHGSDKSIGVVLTPMHSYKRGGLWLAEHQVLRSLAHRSCNVDHAFALVFQALRDTNPYPDHTPSTPGNLTKPLSCFRSVFASFELILHAHPEVSWTPSTPLCAPFASEYVRASPCRAMQFHLCMRVCDLCPYMQGQARRPRQEAACVLRAGVARRSPQRP